MDDVIRNLDAYSRLYIGQYGDMLFYITGITCFHHRHRELNELLCRLRHVMIPDLDSYGLDASLGNWGSKTPKIADKIYDVHQCLRYQLHYIRNIGDVFGTVTSRVPFIHGSWKVPRKTVDRYHQILEDQGLYPDYRKGYARMHIWSCPVIITKYDGNGIEIECTKPVQQIIRDADDVMAFIRDRKITDLFAFLYPDVDRDQYVEITRKIEKCLQEVLSK
jgi:hypothetical protein